VKAFVIIVPFVADFPIVVADRRDLRGPVVGSR
jgi:hypothetical protein